MIIFAVILVILLFLYHSEFNTQNFWIRGRKYAVHNNFHPSSSAQVLDEVNRRVLALQQHMKKKYLEAQQPYSRFDMRARTEQFLENYSPDSLHEISPKNIFGSTSFTEGKGRKIVFCLRGVDGKLHDLNTIMFVALHEITHVLNDRWGHEEYFWALFQIILADAAEIGIYAPVDYRKKPANYCGMQITQNPLI